LANGLLGFLVGTRLPGLLVSTKMDKMQLNTSAFYVSGPIRLLPLDVGTSNVL